MALSSLLERIQKEAIQFVDLRFTDLRGKEQHLSVPAHIVTEQFLIDGKMFDGSSIAGWRGISESDMNLQPDPESAVIDPFRDEATLILRCDIRDPKTQQSYARDPRAIARRAEQYLKSSGIADTVYFGPEPEFFILDDVRWKVSINHSFYEIDAEEASWNSGTKIDGGNRGHRPTIKGGYFPVPPVDSSQDLRSEICQMVTQMGLIVEAHHHEVATCNQNEICTKFRTLLRKADEIQILKYAIQNVAHLYGKTATFMPKPLVGDNGSGMHCHQSLFKDGVNLFHGNEYAGLSQLALYYIGGIIKHAKALNAFTNGTTNSYKRLTPGYEAPVYMAYSSHNRSAAIRIPYAECAAAKRIETRFPDAVSNPYLSFAAQLMAGLDGIRNQIDPGKAVDHDLFSLPARHAAELPSVAATLSEALIHLQEDCAFLKTGDVFTDDLINGYVALKSQEIEKLHMTTHPVEFEMYFSA